MREPLASLEYAPFLTRLDAFALQYCRKQPSLAMIAEMAWVLGVEIDFRLVPRDSGRLPKGEDAGTAAECEASQSGDAEGSASPNLPQKDRP